MLNFGNKEFRNLQEQVQKNADDILKFNYGGAVLSEFGIRVIGRVDSEEDLPDPTGFTEDDVGDAYAVGEENNPPYTLFVLTRPFVEGDPLQWFDIGEFPAPGPQGPAGEDGATGPQGPRGTQIEGGSSIPNISGHIAGDMFVQTTGENAGYVYKLNNERTTWTFIGSIKGPQGQTGAQGERGIQGPQGVQGEQGPQGEPGDSFTIIGVYSDINSAPRPAQAPNGSAVLIGSAAPYHLYVLILLPERQWFDTGAFNDVSVVPLTGTSGTLSTTDYNTLISSPAAMIKLDNEDLFRVNNDVTDYMVYNMVDRYNVQKPTEKYIVITKASRAWQLYTEALLVASDLAGLVTQSDLTTALADKQDKLYDSGASQNIKTINNQSLLGSGNISVVTDLSGYATTSEVNAGLLEKQNVLYYETSGGHTQNIKTINNASPLGTGNISVQEPLVSGTNIKTINNESLLGSGNLTVVTDISGKQDKIDATNKLSAAYISGLATVATSGDYSDLTNKPTIPTVSYPVTDVQVDGTSVLDGTVAKITLPNAAVWGNITGTLSNQTDLVNEFAKYMKLNAGNTLVTGGYLESADGLAIVTSSLGMAFDNKSVTINKYSKTNVGGTITTYPALEFRNYTGNFDSYHRVQLVTDFNATSDYVLKLPNKNGTLATLDDITVGSVAWSDITGKPTFATVATSGSYNDLSNKPSLFSGSYNDLTNKPTIPTKVSDLTNDSGFITSSALSGYATETYVNTAIQGLGTVFTLKGSVANVAALANIQSPQVGDVYYVESVSAGYIYIQKPDTTYGWEQLGETFEQAQANWTQSDSNAVDYIKNKPSLATVATSGSYNDLSNKPSIPAAQIQSDWNQTNSAALDYIKNKPTIPSISGLASLSGNNVFTGDNEFRALYGNGFSVTTGDNEYPRYLQVQSNGLAFTDDSQNRAGISFADNELYIGGEYPTIKFETASTVLEVDDIATKSQIPTKVSDLQNDSGFTTNAGTVTSVRVQAGTGLSSSTSTAQSTTLNTTISIASGYKLPTTTEWNSVYNTSNIVYSATQPSSPVAGMIWLKPVN